MTAVEDPRALLRTLEEQGDSQDEIMRRLVEHLRDLVEAREALESLNRRHAVMHAARTAFIVEAAVLLVEHETGADILSLCSHRRPQLRLVQ
ncbi:hypothetical protein CN154_15220 [Sinorhizobium meliloti]|uniref:hypothetical protein n=1 Tax=Rhizobium meliloti TaxID=382 RepID=UPI000FD82084|nr:hypothetical protein [Sinorhizobium meliloti]RVK75452.1 hypothetical protein CN154_15220 [Sinorhizobium meliloti]